MNYSKKAIKKNAGNLGKNKNKKQEQWQGDDVFMDYLPHILSKYSVISSKELYYRWNQ